MGEIKSTLDLVMARTRHLSMTAEEKRSQQQAEFEKRLKGLLQQYADGTLTVEKTGERFTVLQSEMQTKDLKMLLIAVLRRIDPDRDNIRWLDLLAQEAPALCPPLQAILENYRRQSDDLMTSAGKEQLDRLARDHDISGTAVRCNPDHDPACRERLVALGEKARVQLEALVDQHAS